MKLNIINLILVIFPLATSDDLEPNNLNDLSEAIGNLVTSSKIFNKTLNSISTEDPYREIDAKDQKDVDVQFSSILKDVEEKLNSYTTPSLPKLTDGPDVQAQGTEETQNEVTAPGVKINNEENQHVVNKEENESIDKTLVTKKILKTDAQHETGMSDALKIDVIIAQPDKVVTNKDVDYLSKYLNERDDNILEEIKSAEEHEKPTDYSKSTFVGVPVHVLLPMLRAGNTIKKSWNRGYNGMRRIAGEAYDVADNVMNFIKSNSHNIGDIVFRAG